MYIFIISPSSSQYPNLHLKSDFVVLHRFVEKMPSCPICLLYFDDPGFLDTHVTYTHAEDPKKCAVCDIELVDLPDLLEHYINIHDGQNAPPTECNDCAQNVVFPDIHANICAGSDTSGHVTDSDAVPSESSSPDILPAGSTQADSMSPVSNTSESSIE